MGIIPMQVVAFASKEAVKTESNGEWVCVNGKWEYVQRTLNIVETYFMMDNQILYLQNLPSQRVITVTIVDDSNETVYETETSGTDSLVLSLAAFPAGEYRLELSDTLGSYLYADFTKE
jgi:hypothetical protein